MSGYQLPVITIFHKFLGPDSTMGRFRVSGPDAAFVVFEESYNWKVSVQTIPTPHDGVDGAAFVISSGCKKLGILTDLGHAFKELFAVIPSPCGRGKG